MEAQPKEIRASFDAKTIAVYQAYDPTIAEPALIQQKLVPPFLYDRMTWIKPSFLWMMYRSDWASRAGMTRILQIHISRTAWENALNEAIITTHDPDIHPKAQDWKAAHKAARILVQWDPERGIRTQKIPFRSIQVGITPALSKEFATKWITKILEVTSLARKIHNLVSRGALDEAERLLPQENVYPLPASIGMKLGMPRPPCDPDRD